MPPADPHLPPPAVREWLLSQKWTAPFTSEVTFPDGHPNGLTRSVRYLYQEARVPMGDSSFYIQIPDDALSLLREQLPAHHPV